MDETSLNFEEIDHTVDLILHNEDAAVRERLSLALKVMVYAYLSGKCQRLIDVHLSRLRGE